ncbi:MAG: c-type cytochrome [Hyphomicrobiales bacterium]|nr:c-type cytochrome [Hyphomicrobiales bacterium]MDE2115720.1 c-type cytochrome [Hyphomicrobiales bacterium]
MDSFEFNKQAGSVLATLLFVMALGIFSDVLYNSPVPKIPGYALPSATEAAAAPSAEKAVPLPELLAKADAKKGADDAKVCSACHNFEKGAGVKIGPPLYGVVGRAKGSYAGFAYSDGLKKKGGNWELADINTFITNPKAYVEGTKMAYPGQADAGKRADILAYLNTLADSPAPLPTK